MKTCRILVQIPMSYPQAKVFTIRHQKSKNEFDVDGIIYTRYIYALDHCQTVLVYLLLLVVVVIRSPSELTIDSFVYGSIPYTSISCTPCCLLFVLSLKGRLRTLQILRVLQSTTNRKKLRWRIHCFQNPNLN